MRSVPLAAVHDVPRPQARLLLVEDEVTTMFAMREFFAISGFDVDCAAAADEAIALLDRRIYDAVITDLHLTAHRCGEGLKVAWHARRRHPGSCIVMLTGFETETTEEAAHRCGVDMYQTKPVELSHVCSYVDLALSRNRGAAGRLRELEPKWRQH